MANQRKDTLPSHTVIKDFWVDKYITPTGKVGQIEDFLPDDAIAVVVDDDDPRCFACGVNTIQEESDLESPKPWELSATKKKLDRCHIIPEALGGKASPRNLFLMCHRCHRESPDTTNTSAFFRWVYDWRKTHIMGIKHPVSFAKEVDEELFRRGLPPLIEILRRVPEEDVVRLSQLLTAQEASKYLNANVGMHQFSLAHSSVIIATADYLLDALKEYVPELNGEREASMFQTEVV